MSAIGISVSLLAVVLAIVWIYRRRGLKPEMAGYGGQRMCPACGLITPRSRATCLECGKSFGSPPVKRQDGR
jgi:hypothetical protein